MARISTYTVDSSIDGTEFLLGREADGTTKQFSMSALQTFLATTISPTTSFTNITVSGGGGSVINNVAIGSSTPSTGAFTNITASGTAGITGNATVGGTLGVTGVTTLVDVNVTGEINFDGAPGTAGQYLQSSGDGVTPVWDTLSLNDLSDVLIADSSLYIGHDPTSTDSTAQFNIAVGATALDAITTGDQNIAIGHNAGGAITTVSGVVAIGYEAGKSIVNSSETDGTVLVGNSAGAALTSGCCNTAVGNLALRINTTGTDNTAIGYGALTTLNTSGSDVPVHNTAVGSHAGEKHTFGDKGTYVGSSAGNSVTSGNNNTFIGAESGKATTTGADNVAVGFGSLDTNITSASNTAIGTESLYHSTAAENVAVGYRAGYGVNGQTNSATSNTFVGFEAGKVATTGGFNTAVGYKALHSNTVGTSNVAIGRTALQSNVDGSNAVAIGHGALSSQDPNSASNTHNVAVGNSNGEQITTGVQNTLIGSNAGVNIITGTGNTALGYNTSFSADAAANQTVIGNGATGQGDNIVVIGNSSVTSINPGNATMELGTTTNPFQDLNLSRNIKSCTNGGDLIINQFDGSEVARVHDGGTTQSDTDMSAVGYGFGFKMPVMLVTADGGDKAVTLTAAQSGSIIQCDADTNNIVFTLPVIDAANKAGITYTFVNTTAVSSSSKSIQINTNGSDANDKFLMYGFQGATSITDTDGGDTLTIPSSSAIGTVVKITCLSSGAGNAAEIWLAQVFGATGVVLG